MKPVYQTITETGSGNCFAACLASVFELPLCDLPNFRAMETETGVYMMDAARRWVKDKFNLSIVTVYVGGDDIGVVAALKGTTCIATVNSPNREGGQHAVVGEIGDNEMDFVLTHDPNPNGKNINGKPLFLQFFVPMVFDVKTQVNK